ncbi:ragulator complex protein LAMTOR3 [Lepeophtheirus salmonis]|uniref:Mitogen-activated protein kinase scaffold protein 1 n=1 Tax=Lepeophtheirus salmonis TaxID=72036 RepID=D3PG71_LEPSM|nr:ragulator complex protein LAMTOR3-like [Lepeophtheirus salmonis]ADD24267.1 Mitogen-activated protein kinase scaffold protein 1 [Lepeophtheirus salmonis]
MDSLKGYLKKKCSSVDGVYGIVLSDKEGVPIIKSVYPEDQEPKPQLLSILSFVGEQGSKLGLGKSRLVIANFQNYQVVQKNYSPIMLTIFASKSSNTGQLIELAKVLEPFVTSVSEAIF